MGCAKTPSYGGGLGVHTSGIDIFAITLGRFAPSLQVAKISIVIGNTLPLMYLMVAV
jgi:hypothetical protein